jgi:hypothetical protein
MITIQNQLNQISDITYLIVWPDAKNKIFYGGKNGRKTVNSQKKMFPDVDWGFALPSLIIVVLITIPSVIWMNK